jgi:hypothetical protein
VDPRFERIYDRLTVLQLRPPGDEDQAHFAQYYTPNGIRTVIKEFGLHDKLVAQGLGDYALHITEEDSWHQRLELLLDDNARIMDMRLHLRRASVEGVEEHVDLVVVDWLQMQNPRRGFDPARPRLPGQQFPGTGLGRDVAQLLVLLCRRTNRDGLLVVPERFHLAELYKRGGWRALKSEHDRDIVDVQAATANLSFAARAWAVDRGFVVDDHGRPFDYVPHERLMPVSQRLERALSPGGFLALKEISGLLFRPRRFHVELEALRESLRKDPVEGMDPDAVGR